MKRQLVITTVLLATAACTDRGAGAVQDYPAQYLCRLEAGIEQTDNAAEQRAVVNELERRGISCHEGTVVADNDLF
ncbi:hypothetical protein [Vannielia sp.]|uniref:hypothetical protein n=1 Tax=Vannielia sp. TaxID=2813045 RepID=UPI002615BAB8|nr:hypothetical protein [Vannielia sp.]MDF1871880.1 hypothetical protein [Vannielia sp.]